MLTKIKNSCWQDDTIRELVFTLWSLNKSELCFSELKSMGKNKNGHS